MINFAFEDQIWIILAKHNIAWTKERAYLLQAILLQTPATHTVAQIAGAMAMQIIAIETEDN